MDQERVRFLLFPALIGGLLGGGLAGLGLTGSGSTLLHLGEELRALSLSGWAVVRLWSQVENVLSGNTGAPEAAAVTGTVLGVLTLVRLIPDFLGGWLLLQGAELGRQMEGDPFAPETVELCRTTAKNALWCVNVALAVSLGCDLVQLLLPGALLHLDVQLLLPLPTLLSAAGLLVLCRYMERSKAVYDDNQTII